MSGSHEEMTAANRGFAADAALEDVVAEDPQRFTVPGRCRTASGRAGS